MSSLRRVLQAPHLHRCTVSSPEFNTFRRTLISRKDIDGEGSKKTYFERKELGMKISSK